ncbi:hypothetical protein VMT65_22325 [Nocardia sp. CDC153]|uniref:hypothetical protein n=1 Tax=Nocardia sp. CDC153 TaxID=3112167 RepID=UPI002DBA0933|nr:hypothetical protein [Nocardia sp. CDC153]MEC3955786.1 hypothetical protein [Nocardia sp. CDC153]
MRFTRFAPLVGALSITAVLGTAALVPGAATARADAGDTLAAAEIADAGEVCGKPGQATFDDIITAAASAIRTVVPVEQQAAYDQSVNDFRQNIASVHVHRQGFLPLSPDEVNDRTEFLDDPIVTYLVNNLDAIRTGQVDRTIAVSQLKVRDAVEVFILATRIVKIPAQFAASLVPTVGFVLKPIVGALFNGVKSLARAVQSQLSVGCGANGVYQKLQLDLPDEHVDIPQPLIDLANQVMKADGACTPIAELKTADLVERTRNFLTTASLPVDPNAVNANADALQAFLRDNRVADVMMLRRTEQLGPIVDALDYGPLTFLANLGFDIYEGRALNTVALADVKVENIFALITFALDTTSLLLTIGNTIAGFTGVASTITTPLGIAQTIAFAPATYGAPILRGVMQSMCAA